MAMATLTAVVAQAETTTKTVTRASGREQIISVGNCSSPVMGLSHGVYTASFVKVTCKEYETYNVSVEGSFWNSKETRTSESTISYRVEQETISKTNYQFSGSNTGDAGTDAVINIAEAALMMVDATNQCNNARNTLASVIVPVSQTRCNY